MYDDSQVNCRLSRVHCCVLCQMDCPTQPLLQETGDPVTRARCSVRISLGNPHSSFVLVSLFGDLSTMRMTLEWVVGYWPDSGGWWMAHCSLWPLALCFLVTRARELRSWMAGLAVSVFHGVSRPVYTHGRTFSHTRYLRTACSYK